MIAVIGPFNFPGHLPNGQIVPALLLGNCVVHKPSEKTPSAATWIARCLDEAGLPKGVFNLVQGLGASGQRLTTHPDVDGILFTGSAAVGQRIVRDNAARPDRLIALELGGKNAAIALDDCDLERTARALAFAAFATAGQRCTSTSRLFVTPRIAAPLVARIAEIARGMRVGHPLDGEVFMGPMIAAAPRDALLQAQATARAAGFEPVEPGRGRRRARTARASTCDRPCTARPPSGTRSPATRDNELFGPDLAVAEVADLDAAIDAATRTRFGLAASVFSALARRVRARRRASCASACCTGTAPAPAPAVACRSAGIKESGNHRPAGILAGTACAFPQAVLLEPAPDAGRCRSGLGSGSLSISPSRCRRRQSATH